MRHTTRGLATGGLVLGLGCEEPTRADFMADETDGSGVVGVCDDGFEKPPRKYDPSPATVDIDDLADSADPLDGVHAVGTPWEKRSLSVCFIGGTYTERNWVLQAARAGWADVSGIRLTSLGTCDGPGDADISVELTDEGTAGLSVVGSLSAEVYPSMEILVQYPPGFCDVQFPCDDEMVEGKTRRQICIEGTAIHEFGHALGLLHEQLHPDSTCPSSGEALDGYYDGEPLWPYDEDSVMNYCNSPELLTGMRPSVGDIRTINTLYPAQVLAFSDPDFGGDSQAFAWGHWRDCAGDMDAVGGGGSIRSIVVPPGMRARVCTDSESYCINYIESSNLDTILAGNVERIDVEAVVSAFDEPGFRGAAQDFAPGTYLAVADDLSGVGNDHISSMIVPPTLSARVCRHEGNAGKGLECATIIGTDSAHHAMPDGFDNNVSYIDVTKQVVAFTHTGYSGTFTSYGPGSYTLSSGSLVDPDFGSIAIPYGMRVKLCTSELYGGGDCVNLVHSRDEPVPLPDEIHYMLVSTLAFPPPEPSCFFELD